MAWMRLGSGREWLGLPRWEANGPRLMWRNGMNGNASRTPGLSVWVDMVLLLEREQKLGESGEQAVAQGSCWPQEIWSGFGLPEGISGLQWVYKWISESCGLKVRPGQDSQRTPPHTFLGSEALSQSTEGPPSVIPAQTWALMLETN